MIEIRLYLLLENGHGLGACIEYMVPYSGARVLLDDLEGPKHVVLSLLVLFLKRL